MSTGISGKKINSVASSIRRGGGETMKKILVIAIATMMVMGLAVIANADTAGQWYVQLKATNQDGANGSTTTFTYGCKTGALDGYDSVNDTNNGTGASATTTVYLGCFDNGNGSAQTGYSADKRSVGTTANKWNLKVWMGSQAIATGIKITGWNPSGTYSMNGVGMQMHLRISSIPTALQGVLMLSQNGAAAAPAKVGDEYLFANGVNGTSTLPQMTWLFTAGGTTDGFASIKGGNPPAEGAYIGLELVPEPGSMLAMLSGLVGLVGYGIRRRK